MKLFISSSDIKEDQNIDNSSLLYRIPITQFQNNGWKTATISDIPNLTLKNIQNFCGEKPSVIFIWLSGTYVFKNIPFFWRARKRNFNIKMCWYIDDIHNNIKKRLKYIHFFDVIVNSYAYCFDMFYKKSIKTYWFPHYVNENLLKSITYNNSPKNQILLSGQINEHIYPARHKMLVLSFTDKRIQHLVHPGYNNRNKHKYCGSKYYELINNYLAAFTCCATENRPYIVSKFFEIISCGSLLIAYDVHVKMQLNELGFIENTNYIACTLENLNDVVNYVLDPSNREKIDIIRRNGYELSKKNCFLNKRVSDFCDYIDT